MATEFPRSPIPGLFSPDGRPIFRYDDTSLQRHIDEALVTLGKDQAFATVAFEQNKDAGLIIRFAVAKKLGDHWSMAGVLEHTDDDTSGAIGVRFSD